MPKFAVFIATSLDGYIARNDGGLDWLDRANESIPTGEDFGYKQFFDSVDALLIGRKTFEKVLTFDSWPYEKKQVYVYSSKLKTIPSHLKSLVKIVRGKPSEAAEALERLKVKSVYLDGGATIQSFLNNGLVDELTVTLIPTLIGSGIPLFGGLKRDVQLSLIGSRAYPNGFVQNHYRVAKSKKKSTK